MHEVPRIVDDMCEVVCNARLVEAAQRVARMGFVFEQGGGEFGRRRGIHARGHQRIAMPCSAVGRNLKCGRHQRATVDPQLIVGVGLGIDTDDGALVAGVKGVS